MNINDALEITRKKIMSDMKSRATEKEYLFLCKLFLEFTGKWPGDINPAEIERFKYFLATEKKYSKSSQYLAVRAITYMYRALNIRPPENLKPPRRSRKLPVYLTNEEAVRLIEAANGKFHRAVIRFLLSSGLRVSEMCSLKVEDIDLNEKTVRVESGKGDKDRIVLIDDDTVKALVEYREENLKYGRISPYFFTSQKGGKYNTATIERIVRETSQAAGIRKKITPHTLRHTFATEILKNGGDIRFIQLLLGHSNIGTTEIYTHIDSGAMKELYMKYRPKF
ncbi:site-specific tyrosine recombinase/integron integrase [Caldiplasma sukawensis]